MPFIGRVRTTKTPRQGCLTPRWTYFIPDGTLWKCRKCSSVYRMEKVEWAMDCVRVEWIKLKG